MWKAYYRRQPARLFGTLVMALREQARVSWPRALYAAGAADPGRRRIRPLHRRLRPLRPGCGPRLPALGLPASVDLDTVAHEELRWWVVRREIGLAAGHGRR